jgi:hypothetical protein
VEIIPTHPIRGRNSQRISLPMLEKKVAVNVKLRSYQGIEFIHDASIDLRALSLVISIAGNLQLISSYMWEKKGVMPT